MTRLTLKVLGTKVITEEGDAVIPAPFKQAELEHINPNTAQDFAAILSSLTSKQTIVYGDTGAARLDNKVCRTRQTFNSVHNPWIAFDGDYIINGHSLTHKILAEIDPQLAQCRNVEHNSSSNIIVDNIKIKPHRKKIWYQFESNSQEKIKAYKDIFKKRAVLLGYAEFMLSPKDSTYQMSLKYIFDDAVFSPERPWYEATPIIKASNIEHNTYTNPTEGVMIDCEALPALTSYEEATYIAMMQQLKRDKYKEQQEKKAKVEKAYPDRKLLYTQAESNVVTMHLITTLKEENSVANIVKAVLEDKGDIYLNTSYRDPLDPDYGEDKAKLFHNNAEEPHSLYLHSFAHGSFSYRLAADIMEIFSILPAIPEPVKGHPLRPVEKKKAFAAIKRAAPYLFITDHMDMEFVAESYKHIMPKASLIKMFKDLCVRLSSEKLKAINPLEAYYLYAVKDAPLISYDLEEGLQLTSRAGIAAIMDNRVEGIPGIAVLEHFLVSPDRKEVNGFGLYQEEKRGKLNLWTGFNAVELRDRVIEKKDIALFLEHVGLFAKSPEEVEYFLDWCADLVQHPLRRGPRSAIAIKGDKRTGKSQMTKFIASFFHKNNKYFTTSADSILGRFNSHLASVVFLECAELNFGNTNIKGGKDSMKSLITDETMGIEMKNIDPTTAPNHIHMMLSTNHSIAVLQDSDDVRWTIYEITNERKEDKTWFRELNEWWDGRGKNLVFTYLRQRQYNAETPMSGLITDVQALEKAVTFYNLEDWVFHVLCHIEGTTAIAPTELYDQYVGYIEGKVADHSILKPKKFGLELNKMGVFRKSSNVRIIDVVRDKKTFEERFFSKEFDWEAYIEKDDFTNKSLNNYQDLTDTGAAQSNINIDGA